MSEAGARIRSTSRSLRFLGIAAAAALLALLPDRQATAAAIYFTTDGGAINRVNSDGSGATALVTGLIAPRWVAVDEAQGQMYWTDPGAGRVQRAALDGSGLQTLTSSGNTFAVTGIAVDSAAAQVYFGDHDFGNPGHIYRMNTDGSGLVTLPIPGLLFPWGIAVDANAGKLYWGDGGTQSISRANLDGSNVETVVSGVAVQGIALDVATQTIYWSDFPVAGDRTVRRAGFDGSNMQTLLTGLAGPVGIGLDLAAGRLYVADTFANSLISANLDGSDRHAFLTGVQNLSGLAVVAQAPEPSIAWLLAIGLIVLLTVRRRRVRRGSMRDSGASFAIG